MGTPMAHADALELTGPYALDVLTPNERTALDGHLVVCSEDHSEFIELAGVASLLAVLAEPMQAPAALKRRVLDAYVADTQARPERTPPRVTATHAPSRAPARPGVATRWMAWAAVALGIVLIAMVGIVGLNLRQQADRANQRAEQMTRAVAALAQPGAQVAMLHGSGSADVVSGFVAVPASGTGYMVMTGLPAPPTDMTYQAWYIADGTPTSAGTMAPEADGTFVELGVQLPPGTEVIAVTLEPMGGSNQPTSPPIITGDVATRT